MIAYPGEAAKGRTLIRSARLVAHVVLMPLCSLGWPERLPLAIRAESHLEDSAKRRAATQQETNDRVIVS
jgi:hypothetical protein